jgi:hypothetical protein
MPSIASFTLFRTNNILRRKCAVLREHIAGAKILYRIGNIISDYPDGSGLKNLKTTIP